MQTPNINLQEFERILNEVSEIGFKNSNPNERLSSLLQRLTQKTRTLSGSEVDVKAAFGLAKKLEMSVNFVNNSISQRNITKKTMVRSKISETILASTGKKKLNGTSVENAIRPMKSDEKKLNLSNALTGKHTRTSSLDAKVDGITEKTIPILNNTQAKLSKAKLLIKKLNSRNFQETKPKKNLRFSYKSVDYLQRARKISFSSGLFLKIILRSWFLYVKSKKQNQRPPSYSQNQIHR